MNIAQTSSVVPVVDADVELRGIDPDVVGLSIRVTSSPLSVSPTLIVAVELGGMEFSTSVVVVIIAPVVAIEFVPLEAVEPLPVSAETAVPDVDRLGLVVADGTCSVVCVTLTSVGVVDVVVGILLPVLPAVDIVAVVITELLSTADVEVVL